MTYRCVQELSRIVPELSRIVPELSRIVPELSRVVQSCPELESLRVAIIETKKTGDRRTDGRTDTASYRDARTHLKTISSRNKNKANDVPWLVYE